ncbi:MAG: hypothetical protein QOF89_3171 [Acidobacteriota bacterium]|jgi:hypothetical protein|nr:hypothetical protein [Acidobacteriota bacterium]
MVRLDPKDPSAFERLQEIIGRIAPKWRSQPNVLDVVPALKTRGGRVQPDALVLGFHVTEKVGHELLADRGYEAIPPEIEGVPTDVILARQPALDGSVDARSTRSQMFDTLIGGIAVGNADRNAYGTLGMTLLAVSDNRLVGITNEHVLVFDGEGQVGDEVQQPRFYLNSEVSLDSASCCPGGQLHYRGVDNPIVDASVAVFAAAALAAALSDEIDPHRRGQEATIPDAGERTLREVVSVSLDYPEIPFPGRSYSMGVDWTYQRHTDRRVLEHAVTETKANEHVIAVQELVTDKPRYFRGETVRFLAALSPEAHRKTCHNYFVTAAALSPSHHRAYKVILRPAEGSVSGVDALTHGSASHGVEGGQVRRCWDYRRQRRGDRFSKPRTIDGVLYDPEQRIAELVGVTAAGGIGLRFPAQGLTLLLPSPVRRVIAQVLVQGEAVTLKAFSGASEVDSATTSGPELQTLSVAASAISRLVFQGGSGKSLLMVFCVESGLGAACLYRGELQLAPNEELGPWQTFLFAQTLNDVPLGTPPEVAAQTIGGLPVTDNFTDDGESDHFIYGHQCNVGLAPNGAFEVVEGGDEEEEG